MKEKMLGLPMELYHNKRLILSLSRNDFKTKYAGFFQNALYGRLNALMEYNYLIKKVVFKISILHIYTYSSYTADFLLYWLHVCFYISSCICTSAIVAFFRDSSSI